MALRKYFRRLFAVDGDKVEVPNDTQVDNTVSYQQGYTPNYSLIPADNPNRLPIEREDMNGLFADITGALKEYQERGVPDYITPDQNDGNPFPYPLAARVRYESPTGVFKIYESLVDNNTDIPTDTVSWKQIDGRPVAGPDNDTPSNPLMAQGYHGLGSPNLSASNNHTTGSYNDIVTTGWHSVGPAVTDGPISTPNFSILQVMVSFTDQDARQIVWINGGAIFERSRAGGPPEWSAWAPYGEFTRYGLGRLDNSPSIPDLRVENLEKGFYWAPRQSSDPTGGSIAVNYDVIQFGSNNSETEAYSQYVVARQTTEPLTNNPAALYYGIVPLNQNPVWQQIVTVVSQGQNANGRWIRYSNGHIFQIVTVRFPSHPAGAQIETTIFTYPISIPTNFSVQFTMGARSQVWVSGSVEQVSNTGAALLTTGFVGFGPGNMDIAIHSFDF